MDRATAIARIGDSSTAWDLLIVGGGATGLGAAVDASTRGLRTLLVEQSDFGKGTSSRSTKLIHGGVRYLRQGNIALVRQSLHERARLLHAAPHLSRPLAFIVPSYRRWDSLFYGVGLNAYGWLAGRQQLGRTRWLPVDEVMQRIPTLDRGRLRGGMQYYDGQFDDARLAVCLARTAVDHGATVANYMRVASLVKHDGRAAGALLEDLESGQRHEVRAKVVINATGVFADALRSLDDPQSPPLLAASRGAHVVLDRAFLPGNTALMVPKTDDGRVLFAIPWLDRVVLGTTDVPATQTSLEPRATDQEIHFLLSHAGRYLNRQPERRDVLSVFAGLRPLVQSGTASAKHTAALSRDHLVSVSESGMVTITGGKWTTYRLMAADAVDTAVKTGGLAPAACRTESLRLHGAPATEAATPDEPPSADAAHLAAYGDDAQQLIELEANDPSLRQALHTTLPLRASQVVYAARSEMARTVEDVLARRTRLLLLDARAAIDAAPMVARLLAGELRQDDARQQQQVDAFTELARGYLPD